MISACPSVCLIVYVCTWSQPRPRLALVDTLSVGAIHGMSGTGSYLPWPGLAVSNVTLRARGRGLRPGWSGPCPVSSPVAGSAWPPVTVQPRWESEPPESGCDQRQQPDEVNLSPSSPQGECLKMISQVFHKITLLYFWRASPNYCTNKIKLILKFWKPDNCCYDYNSVLSCGDNFFKMFFKLATQPDTWLAIVRAWCAAFLWQRPFRVFA